MDQKFLAAYGGETTEQLLALEGEYRIDSLVLAFEEGIQRSSALRPTSKEERCVLAVEALEREVNNGGYSQFFVNSSNEFVDVVGQALLAIGCPRTALITQDAIAVLDVPGPLTGATAEAVILADNPAVLQALGSCDDRYFSNDEPIADRLFAWIKQNQAAIRVGGA